MANLDIPKLPDNIIERIDQLINVLFSEDDDWDALVMEMVSLISTHEVLKELMFEMFKALECFDMPKLKKDVPLACENLLAILAMKFVSPSPLLEAAGQAVGAKSIRGRPALVKLLNRAYKFKEEIVSVRSLLKCPKCQGVITASTKFCRGCGHNMHELQSSHSDPNATVECSKCQFQMLKADAYCDQCGQANVINDAKGKKVTALCHHCQHLLGEGAAFCSACGACCNAEEASVNAEQVAMIAPLEKQKALAVALEDYAAAMSLKEKIAKLKLAGQRVDTHVVGSTSATGAAANVAPVPPAPSSLVAAEIQHLEARLNTE